MLASKAKLISLLAVTAVVFTTTDVAPPDAIVTAPAVALVQVPPALEQLVVSESPEKVPVPRTIKSFVEICPSVVYPPVGSITLKPGLLHPVA
jgi:hypothetical protein